MEALSLVRVHLRRSGVAESGSPLCTPLSVEASFGLRVFFISLCGLICLRGGKVPRCGLARILLQCERRVCWRGTGRSKTKAESPRVHTLTFTQCTFMLSSLCCCVCWLMHTISLIHSHYRR